MAGQEEYTGWGGAMVAQGSAVELCFGATERSVEAYALAEGGDDLNDFHDHTYAYQRAFELGVLSRDLRDDYRALYTENRSESYYGDRGATNRQAEAMLDLAAETHEIRREQPQDHYRCRGETEGQEQ
jgi:hypothetical protein